MQTSPAISGTIIGGETGQVSPEVCTLVSSLTFNFGLGIATVSERVFSWDESRLDESTGEISVGSDPVKSI